MKSNNIVPSMAFVSFAAFGFTPDAIAQPNTYYAGQASNGQSVVVDLYSISQASSNSVNFVYSLGGDRIPSQAHCNNGNWTTFDDGTSHRPQSQATQNMLSEVCSYLEPTQSYSAPSQTAYVFDPPSNVRISPNGSILCSIEHPTNITTYGHTGSWYYTDACGSTGVIDSSQIQF